MESIMINFLFWLTFLKHSTQITFFLYRYYWKYYNIPSKTLFKYSVHFLGYSNNSLLRSHRPTSESSAYFGVIDLLRSHRPTSESSAYFGVIDLLRSHRPTSESSAYFGVIGLLRSHRPTSESSTKWNNTKTPAT